MNFSLSPFLQDLRFREYDPNWEISHSARKEIWRLRHRKSRSLLWLSCIFVAFSAPSVPSCQANLGDSPEQIKARYGGVIYKFGDKGETTFRFHRPGVELDTIDVRFQDGKSQEEIHLHWKSKALDQVDETGSFSNTDTEAFLKANAQGLTWRKQPRRMEGVTTWLLGSSDPQTALARAVRSDEEHSFRVVLLTFDSSRTMDAGTAAALDALFPETQPRKPVAERSPVPLKPNLLPVLKIFGQPQPVVNKLLGNPTQHWPIHEPEKREGGTTNQYPNGTNWLSLMVDFYRNEAVWISFHFSQPYPASEQELFDVLGLPKNSFQKTFENRANTGYRGTIDKRVIEILAMHQGRDGGFCQAVNIELVATLD